MKKQPQPFEWHYLDSASGEEAWATTMAGGMDPPPAATQAGWMYDPRLRNFLLPLSVLLCVLAVSASYWLWQSAQSGLAKIRQEIQLVAMADLGGCVDAAAAKSNAPRLDAQATNEPQKRAAPVPDACLLWQHVLADLQMQAAIRPDQPLALQIAVAEVDLNEAFALAQVLLTAPDSPETPAYLTTLVFAQTEAGWRYSSGAHDALWGERRMSQSPLLQVEYHDRDAAELSPLAETLEAQFAGWRTAFGLGATPAKPILIRSATAFTEPNEEFWASPPNELTIPSPLLLVRPADQPVTAAFEGRASHFLLLNVIDEALRDPDFLADAAIPEQWRIMVDGFYFSLQRTEPAVEPHRQVLALELPLSLITFGPESTQTVFTNASSRDSERGWIVFSRPSLNYPGQYWAAESVAEYILQSYEPARIAAMLSALPYHESWETLAPDVFGVDRLTFQAQWRDYVATHYPLE